MQRKQNLTDFLLEDVREMCVDRIACHKTLFSSLVEASQLQFFSLRLNSFGRKKIKMISLILMMVLLMLITYFWIKAQASNWEQSDWGNHIFLEGHMLQIIKISPLVDYLSRHCFEK